MANTDLNFDLTSYGKVTMKLSNGSGVTISWDFNNPHEMIHAAAKLIRYATVSDRLLDLQDITSAKDATEAVEEVVNFFSNEIRSDIELFDMLDEKFKFGKISNTIDEDENDDASHEDLDDYGSNDHLY
jgi:hypothetical protein